MTTELQKNVAVRVDAGQWLGELPHHWTYIGYDEINYTYTPEGQELLAKFMALEEQPYYIRVHHLLCTGNCHAFYKWGSTNAYLEDETGTPIYDWTIVDLVFDTILQHRCKPFVELGFMPQDLADPERYDRAHDTWTMQQYRTYGWACPPKDYQKWYDLIYKLVRHCLERYGAAEIRSWYWELWNEPDLDYYWKGSIAEFTKLYDFTAAAVKAACPDARVGGPGTTNPVPGRRSAEFLDAFLDHCTHGTNALSGRIGTELDFVSFHVKGGGYAADPKQRQQPPPSVQRVLRDIQAGHAIISKYLTLKDHECVLSEIDPDGWAAGGAWDNANLNFRNTEYYPSFVTSAFDKAGRYARQHQWDLKCLTWAFLFVGERCFEGTRVFSTQGIDKPILNLFRMYAKLGRQELLFESTGTQDPLSYDDRWGRGTPPEISGFATLTGNQSVEVLIYNHHDDWNEQGEYAVDLAVENLPFEAQELVLRHYRIDRSHSNAYPEWVRQGKPMYPAPGQQAAIQARAGLELVEPPRRLTLTAGKVQVTFTLPVHSISLLVLAPSPAGT